MSSKFDFDKEIDATCQMVMNFTRKQEIFNTCLNIKSALWLRILTY
jgi:hypothetical protein